MPDIFVSYARADRDRVAPLVALLEAEGWSVWWDRELVPGAAYERMIDTALNESRAVVVIWSNASVDSEWVQAEAGEGLDRRILVPVLLDDVRVPISFRRKHAAHLVGWPQKTDQKELSQLIEGIRACLATRGTDISEPQAAYLSRGKKPFIRTPLLAGALAGVIILSVIVMTYLKVLTPGAPTAADIPLVRLLVLPFSIKEGDLSQDFSDMSFEIAEQLAHAPNIIVSTEVSDQAPNERATEVVLSGEYRVTDDKTVLQIRLSSPQRKRPLWENQFSVRDDQLPQLVDDITRQTARALDLQLPSNAKSLASISSKAYLAYLNGRAELRKPTDSDPTIRANAIHAFETAIQIEPRFVEAFAGLCRAQIAEYSGSFDQAAFVEAERHCNRALTLAPDNIEVLTALGSLYQVAGLNEQSATSLERALSLKPYDPEASRVLAEVYGAMGMPARAEELARTLIQIEPAFWKNYRLLGRLYFIRGDYREAAEQFELEAELSTNKAAPMLNLGSARYLNGEFSEAIKAWRVSAAIDTDPSAYSNLGAAEFFSGDFQEAARMYDRAIQMQPNNHTFWGNAAEARYFGDAEDSIRFYEEARTLVQVQLQINPDDPELLSAHAIYLAGLGQEKEALREIESALKQGDELWTWYDAARVYARIDRTADSKEALERALTLGYPIALAKADANFGPIRDEIPAFNTTEKNNEAH